MSEQCIEVYDPLLRRDSLMDRAAEKLMLVSGSATISAFFVLNGVEALVNGYVPGTSQEPRSYATAMAVGAACTAKVAQHFLSEYRQLKQEAVQIDSQAMLGVPSEALGFPGFHIQ